MVSKPGFEAEFVRLFRANHERLYRYLHRLSGEPELAADLAQETFVRLYRRKALPDRPDAWLITVAMNLFRNARTTRSRRMRLLTEARSHVALADAQPSEDAVLESGELQARVRGTLERMPERDRNLLLLRAEGYCYRDIATALALNEASVGTLLARAKAAFREGYEAECT